MQIGSYETHPAADVFPLLEGTEFEALCADIKAYGLREPITRVWIEHEAGNGVRKELILDGRNRLRACLAASVQPRFEDYEQDDHFEFVWSANKERRHLEPGMAAVLWLELMKAKDEWRKAQAKALESKRAALRGNQNAAKKNNGDNVVTTVSARPKNDEKKARTEIAKAAGVGAVTAQKAITLDKEAPELFQAVREQKVTLNQAYRQHTREKAISKIAGEPQPLPTGQFRVIVADPPWAYEKRKDDGTHRTALSYPSMTTDEICALPIGDRALGDCVLWLWTTNAFMRDAFRVLDAWGFQEKTILTWAKDRMGTGDWLRGKTEHCIMAVRGKPVVSLTNQTTLLNGPVREHSRKPDEFYALVEALCPGSKLEIFAREPREGWTGWGAESDKFDAAS